MFSIFCRKYKEELEKLQNSSFPGPDFEVSYIFRPFYITFAMYSGLGTRGFLEITFDELSTFVVLFAACEGSCSRTC